MNSKYLKVGIDPAFRKKGFCVCVIDEQNDVAFTTFKNGFLDFLEWLKDLPKHSIIGVENSAMQNATFETPADKKKSVSIRLRKSRDVGKNQAASQYTVDVCRAIIGTNKTIEISPRMKGVKWSDKTFLRAVKSEGHNLLNYTGSQDQRDAYKLALQAWQFRYRLKL